MARYQLCIIIIIIWYFWTFMIACVVFIKTVISRVLQHFPFAFPNTRIDFPGIPEFSFGLIPPSLIYFDRTYHMLSLTNFQSYECGKWFTAILYVVWCLFHTFSLFCRFQWHLIYIFFPLFHINFFWPGITSRKSLPASRIISRNPATRESLQLTSDSRLNNTTKHVTKAVTLTLTKLFCSVYINISYKAHSSNVNFYTGNITLIWLFISFWHYIFVLMCR